MNKPNPDYRPLRYRFYEYRYDGSITEHNAHCPNPYLAWAKEIKYPFIIPVFYKKTNDRPT